MRFWQTGFDHLISFYLLNGALTTIEALNELIRCNDSSEPVYKSLIIDEANQFRPSSVPYYYSYVREPVVDTIMFVRSATTNPCATGDTDVNLSMKP